MPHSILAKFSGFMAANHLKFERGFDKVYHESHVFCGPNAPYPKPYVENCRASFRENRYFLEDWTQETANFIFSHIQYSKAKIVWREKLIRHGFFRTILKSLGLGTFRSLYRKRLSGPQDDGIVFLKANSICGGILSGKLFLRLFLCTLFLRFYCEFGLSLLTKFHFRL